MIIHENLIKFAGRRVEDWNAEAGMGDLRKFAYRIRVSYDDSDKWPTLFASYLADPKVAETEALVVGNWGEVASGDSSDPIVEALAAARDKLPKLRHLFFGDIISEESEISWINQSDISPLLEAYPALAHLTIRGGMGLSLGSPRHATLRELTIQTGGLPPSVVHELAGAELPALEHLELWLGDPNYGGDVTVEDLAPLLKGDRFPKLRYLGLKDSVIQDEIAGVVALAPITGRLEVLDLSLGTLSDAGAKALVNGLVGCGLKTLKIHHHYVSDTMLKELRSLAVEVDAEDQQKEDEWGGELHRYIAVSE